jgi:hypothetical protein
VVVHGTMVTHADERVRSRLETELSHSRPGAGRQRPPKTAVRPSPECVTGVLWKQPNLIDQST